MKMHFTISTALEFFVVALGITSSVNTFTYIMHVEDNLSTALTTSLVLGLALILGALAASRIDRRQEGGWFWLAIGVTAAFAVVSGGLQTALHYHHSANWLYSAGLGFVLPVVGEIGGAVLASTMKRIERERALREVSTAIEATIADNLGTALASFDPARIERHIDRTLNQLAVMAVNDVADRTRRIYQHPASVATIAEPDAIPAPSVADEHSPSADPAALDQSDRITQVNQQRSQKAAERRQQLLGIVQADFAGTPPDELNRSELARRLSTSARTIARDLQALAESGQLATPAGVTA